MKQNHPSFPFVYKLFGGLLVFSCMFIAACVFGAADTTVKDVWLALTSNTSSDEILIIREIRLPREIGAVVVGAALSVAGAIMQGLTRNPLADPGLLGLTAGAKAALALSIAFIPALNYYGIMVACFIGAAVGAIMVFGIGALKKGGFSPLRIVLAGAAVSAFLFAVADGIGLYFKISKDVSMWTAGGLIGTNWNQLQVIAPFVLAGIVISFLCSRQLTILSLSEEVAVGLGQKIMAVKTILFIVIILLSATSVALVGNIAFVGLLVPHIVRTIVGTDYRFILPMSAIVGASFMLFADTVARMIHAPYETPIVAIAAVIGLPFFLMIVRKGGKAFS
jgi:iron complex transport system permease protein